MTINGSIPGPVLRFKEGDSARINVHNKMNVDTSIHWYGILIPPDMDGVPYISFPPIAPGTTFTYEFPIRQKWTYCYHSHTNLQEQAGVYGAIVIDSQHEYLKTDRDYAVVLSDWTYEDPHEVLRTLKMGSEWYTIEKGGGQSIFGAYRLGLLRDYFKRELQRMPPMDISDVAYDRFLANGKPGIVLPANPGEIVRLRIIDGSATSYFHLEFAGGPMHIISADGQDVEPVEVNRFLIGVAETYDVIFKVPSKGAYEFRATAHDGSGYASVWIGEGMHQPAPAVPRPNLYHSMRDLSIGAIFALTPAGSMGMDDEKVKAGIFDMPGMMGMGSMNMDHGHEMKDMGSNEDASMDMEHKGHQLRGMIPDSNMQMDHGDHEMKAYNSIDFSGKKYGRDFSFFGADVSSSEKLAIDGMDPNRPWPPYAKFSYLLPFIRHYALGII